MGKSHRAWSTLRNFVQMATPSSHDAGGASSADADAASSPRPLERDGGGRRGGRAAKTPGFMVNEDTVNEVLHMVRQRMGQRSGRPQGHDAHGRRRKGKRRKLPDWTESFIYSQSKRFMSGETEDENLAVIECDSEGHFWLRIDMTDTKLLAECRSISRALQEDGLQGKEDGRQKLQLRDIRRLRSFGPHCIVARRGAVIMNMGLLSGIVTHCSAYIVVPDGAEDMLQSLMSRLQTRMFPSSSDRLPFELFFVESVLHTLVTHHIKAVEQCFDAAHHLTAGVGRLVSSKTVERSWALKHTAAELARDISGSARAIEDLQRDSTMVSLLYLSAMERDAALHDALTNRKEGNTELAALMLDAYVSEFYILGSHLEHVEREVSSAEDLTRLLLSVSRNNLWKVDVLFTMSAMWMSFAMLGASMSGTNMGLGGENMVASPYDHTSWHDCGDCSKAKGPSWVWMDVTVTTGFGSLMFIIATAWALWRHGYLHG